MTPARVALVSGRAAKIWLSCAVTRSHVLNSSTTILSKLEKASDAALGPCIARNSSALARTMLRTL